METIPVSKFKAMCLAVVQRVKRTGHPVLITRFGEPIAEVIPPSRRSHRAAWLGCMQGSVEMRGDEVAPALAARRWNALRRR
jgi:prevent-host-death family protein